MTDSQQSFEFPPLGAPEAIISVRGYPVVVGSGLLSRAGVLASDAAPAARYAIVTDSHVAPLYAERARLAFAEQKPVVITMLAGEENKTREQWSAVTDAMLADHLGRDTTVVALGGGVVGDLAGFVAATFMRGVPVVQLPTTLLAMIDASVGGKTGVDTPAGKNLVGAFHQPSLVVADLDTLKTLPIRQLRSGLAEAIKHGVIASESYFQLVSDRCVEVATSSPFAPSRLSELVTGSIRIKASVVERDERENGVRKILNFGHTLGHAIELVSGYSLLHGEAIAVGMVLEAAIAEDMGLAESGVRDAIVGALTRAGLPTAIPRGFSTDEIVSATRFDKKARDGVVEYSLPKRVGEMAGEDSAWGVRVPDQVVARALAG